MTNGKNQAQKSLPIDRVKNARDSAPTGHHTNTLKNSGESSGQGSEQSGGGASGSASSSGGSSPSGSEKTSSDKS